MFIRVTIMTCLCMLSACATNNRGVVAPVSTSSPAVERETSSTPEPQSSSTTISEPVGVEGELGAEGELEAQPEPEPPPATPASTLLASVDDAIAAGDLERAAALNERALRIAPRDAYLWFRLADIRYQQRQFSNAEGFARRALSFAGNNQALTQDINQLLARIRQAIR